MVLTRGTRPCVREQAGVPGYVIEPCELAHCTTHMYPAPALSLSPAPIISTGDFVPSDSRYIVLYVLCYNLETALQTVYPGFH